MSHDKRNEIIQLAKQEMPQLKAIIGLSTKKGTDVETLALQELEYLQMHCLAKPEIYDCLPQTIIASIKSVLKQNLSLDPDAGLVYVTTRNLNVGTKDSPQLVKVLEAKPTSSGIISINRQTGRILDVERPEIIKDQSGKVIGVKVKFLVPSYDENGKKCAKWREVEFDESDFSRWRRASHNEKSRGKSDAATKDYSNPNYSNFKGGPDPEFIRSKALRHGLSFKRFGTNLNERPAVVISTSQPDLNIDLEKDKEVVEDEYINHEDVNASNESHTNSNGVHVTVHEEMDIPKSSDL